MPGPNPAVVLYASWAPFFSGAERALLVLLDSLDRRRHRPVVAVGTRGQLAEELEDRRITVRHVPVVHTGLRTAARFLVNATRLAQLARREQAVLVHANDVPSFQPAGYAARWLGLPAITHVRFPDTQAGFEWFLKPGFSRALFVSAALREDALGQAPGLFADRNEVVYDGVPLPVPCSADDVRARRAELGIPTDRTVVAFTGQVSEIKGIWDFIDAAEQLIGQGVPAAFVVLGDDVKNRGQLRRTVEAAVRERGLSTHITFLGFRPDAPRLIPAFDIVVVPSHVEPLGNATLEAMAASRPVVGTRVGGIPEMIVHGETGWLVPPLDPRSLADAVGRLVSDPGQAGAFGRAGRGRATRIFSPATNTGRVQDVYERLVRAG